MPHHYLVVEELKRHEVILSTLVNERRDCFERSNVLDKTIKEEEEKLKIQEKELEITRERVRNLLGERNRLTETLKDVDLELKKTVEIVENTNVIFPITVGDEGNFTLSNGLVDINLYVFIKLLNILDDLKIVGMAEIFYYWCKKPIFKLVRNSYLRNTFRRNPEGKYTLTCAPEGILCESLTSEWRTFFLKLLLSHGIFHWVVRISYKNKSTFLIGAAPPFLLTQLDAFYFTYSIQGSCGFGFNTTSNYWLNGTDTFPDDDGKVEDNSLVAVEADIERRTLCFFLNGKKISFAVCDVQVPLHLGVSGNDKAIFTSVSFRRISAPTASPVVCKYHASL